MDPAAVPPNPPPQPESVCDRRLPVWKNSLLNLAFEDSDPTQVAAGDCLGPRSVPADVFQQGVREHAIVMGMILPADEAYLWIAEESLLAPLPEGWVQLKDEESGQPYYYNQKSTTSSWEHPRDGFYTSIYQQQKAESEMKSIHATYPVLPEPPAMVAQAPKFDEWRTGTIIRYGAEDVAGDGDSACGEDLPVESTAEEETQFATARETDCLRNQLEKAKNSRKTMTQQHDEAWAKLEQTKESLEDKIAEATEELRQERRRFRAIVVEQERADKTTRKLRETTQQLEEKLEREVRRADELAASLAEVRDDAEQCNRQLAEANAQADAELTRRDQEKQRRWTEATRSSQKKVDGMQELLQVERDAFSAEADQLRAKLDFQVDERVRDAVDSYRRREQSLTRDLDAIRVVAGDCKEELAKTKRDATAAEAAHTTRMAEAAWEAQLLSAQDASRDAWQAQVHTLTQALREADSRLEALAVDVAEKNTLLEEMPKLQRATIEAQEGLRAANTRFDREVTRMNTDIANAEEAVEKRLYQCKRLAADLDDSEAKKEKAEALEVAAREEVKRLSAAAVGTETALTKTQAKLEALTRHTKDMQQEVDAAEALKKELQSLENQAAEARDGARRKIEGKQRELELCRREVEKGDALSRQLHVRLAEAEGLAVQERGATLRLTDRVSSLETEVLEARAALTSVQIDRDAIAEELATANETNVQAKELKAEIVEANEREEALRAEMDAAKTALQGAEEARERESKTWAETNVELQKQAESAEKRCERLTEQNCHVERRFQQDLGKSKEREARMWTQLQQVSSSFVAAATRRKEEESDLDGKLLSFEKRARGAEEHALALQLECERVKDGAYRDATAKDAELEALRERVARKKAKFSAEKLSLQEECQCLTKTLAEARVAEEGIKARYADVMAREEQQRDRHIRLQETNATVCQEVARANAEVNGLKSRVEDLQIMHRIQVQSLRDNLETSRKKSEAAAVKYDTDLKTVEEERKEAESACNVLRNTVDRLEGDLASLTAQVSGSSIGEHRRDDGSLNVNVNGRTIDFVQAQEKIQELLSRLETSGGERAMLEKQLSASTAEIGDEKCRTIAAQAEADGWMARFKAEKNLRRALNARILDMQGSIRVLCRLRPLQQGEVKLMEENPELEEATANITYVDDDRLSFWGVPYRFDRVFGPGTEQAKVFDEVQPVIASVLDGYRVCVFAYGQTGSGKTYTMEGPRHDRGVNFRALGELFSLSTQDITKDFSFRVSMLEVYNESVKDLLVKPGRHAATTNKHDIRLDKKGRVYVEGLVECEVDTLEQVEEMVVVGGRNRTVGDNNVNEHSSRSHLVLQVHVTSVAVEGGDVQHGKLNLIDLAGSERIKSTAAEGQQLKEAQNINRSLSALGDVINALGSGSKHVPYRNSKLTFLLQDSLSANAKVLMFVNISPVPQSQGESLCSLNFAKRCRSVQLGTARRIGTR